MKAYQQERFENVICFFAREHHKKTHAYPWQTQIYKYLAFFDFELLEETGEAPLDQEYLAMAYGPVPRELYEQRDSYVSELFRIKDMGDNRRAFVALKKPNLDYFSDREIEKMNNLIEIYAVRQVNASMMSEGSHEKIKAWRKAREDRPNGPVDKADTFEDILTKPEEQLTQAEEHFLIARALKEA
ncbi:MAG: DUF4065 domain-containing protein [Spirochaetes bacterium]|nr:DUF4065 domain-containing protein [Spirochaetota bacterium]